MRKRQDKKNLKQKQSKTPPEQGQLYFSAAEDRFQSDVSRGLTPYDVDRIMTSANTGDVEQQARLSLELEEKNHDIAHAMQTRQNAVLGCEWEVTCTDTSAIAKMACKELEHALKSAGFFECLTHLSGAVIPGYAAVEILWGAGGTLEGFSPIDTHAVTFVNSAEPRLRLADEAFPAGFPPNKVIFQKMSKRFELARGGLIRPLAWLHCFQNLGLKDVLSFIERYGQPFVVATANQTVMANERSEMIRLIRNFGPNGGGLFSEGTTLSLLQAANNTGDCYFRLLDYCEKAITKVLLGQTAASGDASGWSKGSAQSQVRQDILDADCRSIEAAVNRQLFAVWQAFNLPGLSAPLELRIKSEPPEDETARYNAQKAYAEMMGIFGRGGFLTPSVELEAHSRERMGLPPMSEEVKQAWAESKGVRAPITLQSGQALSGGSSDPGVGFAESPRMLPARTVKKLADPDAVADEAASDIVKTGALEKWLGPVRDTLESVTDGNDASFEAFLRKPKVEFGSSEAVEQTLTDEAATAAVLSGAKGREGGGK